MTRAVVICPGRGTYNKNELGVLRRLHGNRMPLFKDFDQIRTTNGQEPILQLDAADRYSVAKHTRGDNASALIYAASFADFHSISGVDIVAITGNSMGWYTALACAGALTAVTGFEVANTMGTLMQQALIGGQLVYPVVGEEWQPDPNRKRNLLEIITEIQDREDHALYLSIDLGGMLVIAGNTAGLDAFVKSVPVQDRFPLRLANHAAFHTPLQHPVSLQGKQALSALEFNQPDLPLIDGRGSIWWPDATEAGSLKDYTFGHQITAPYDFARALQVAAREFAPDIFIVTGPGDTLGSAVAQSLIQIDWKNMNSKQTFNEFQNTSPVLISMGRNEQRDRVT